MIQKGHALIKQAFGGQIDPKTLTIKEWCENYQQAIWLKYYDLKNQFQLLTDVLKQFVPPDKKNKTPEGPVN